MEISDGNGNDLESPLGFSFSEPPILESPTWSNVTRASLDKSKSKMRVIEKLPMKRK